MHRANKFSPPTKLLESISAEATQIVVEDSSVFSPPPNLATISVGGEGEVIRYNGLQNNTLINVERGIRGEARHWDAGSAIARRYSSEDHDIFIENIMTLNEGLGRIRPIELGGTGGNSAATARANLGITPENIGAELANVSIPRSNIAAATGGILPLARGGTNAGDAATARSNLQVQPTSNPTFTGIPRVPNALASSNDTQVASTQWVRGYVPTSNGSWPCALTAHPAGVTMTTIASQFARVGRFVYLFNDHSIARGSTLSTGRIELTGIPFAHFGAVHTATATILLNGVLAPEAVNVAMWGGNLVLLRRSSGLVVWNDIPNNSNVRLSFTLLYTTAA